MNFTNLTINTAKEIDLSTICPDVVDIYVKWANAFTFMLCFSFFVACGIFVIYSILLNREKDKVRELEEELKKK